MNVHERDLTVGKLYNTQKEIVRNLYFFNIFVHKKLKSYGTQYILLSVCKNYVSIYTAHIKVPQYKKRKSLIICLVGGGIIKGI